MLDTKLMASGDKNILQGSKLEVDKFFCTDVLGPNKPEYNEAVIFSAGEQKKVYLLFTDVTKQPEFPLAVKSSADNGRTWPETWPIKDKQGAGINGIHCSLIQLKSGRLGLVHTGESNGTGHPGREGGLMMFFRTSDDQGKTWSDPVPMSTTFSCCCAGHAQVLLNGRIVAPAFKWVSPIPGNDAEGWILNSNEPSPTLSYSFTYVSDDEGKTWSRSLSELFVSVRRAAFDLEEPSVVELKDGRLLMHLRSELGRIYRSYSKDKGTSWSRPEGLQIASAYTPTVIKRMPNNNLLMIWNQSSRQEIMAGLHRHRLSCAVSGDEGETWENFKNLESLDDATVITPPPADWVQAVEPYESYGYYQPQPGLKRYHRAPGILRICYPSVAFSGGEALITYDIGYGTLGEKAGIRLRAIPLDWFLQP